MAEKSIVLIDDYVDEDTFKVLGEKGCEVMITICSKNRIMAQTRNVSRRKMFSKKIQYLEGKNYQGRYLLIDGTILYILSRSLKFNAKRNFYFIRIHDFEQITKIRQSLESDMKRAKSLCRHF